MKVLLMVEREGRVVLAGRAAKSRTNYYTHEAFSTQHYVSNAVCEATLYSRWWLVEAESAAAARIVIRCSQGDCDSPEGCVCKNYGRILASGGMDA